MIDHWTLYWVLKLDDILGVVDSLLFGLPFLSLMALLLSIVGLLSTLDEGTVEYKYNTFARRSFTAAVIFIVAVVAPLYLAKALVPSTKQMAAIIVLPKIVTQENVLELTDEAKELYLLAKEGLKNMVDTEDEQ